MPDPNIAPVTGTGAVVFDDESRGDTVLRTATGRFHHLVDPPVGLVAHATDPDRHDVAAYVDRLRAEVVDREHADARSRWPHDRRDVAVVGYGPIASDIAEALGQIGVRVHRLTDTDAVDPTTVALVVALAEDEGRCDDGRWDGLDELPQRGVAWLRAYREGTVWFVDPVSTDPADPSARQVTRRRLAAQPVPRHAQTWRRAVGPASHEPTALDRIRVADRVLAVALAWAQDDPRLADHRRTLWKYVSATGRATEHLVLSYPEPAP